MKFLRHPRSRYSSISFLPTRLLTLALLLLSPLAVAVESSQWRWAGNWLVVGQNDQQLVWQLHADGSGFAYGFRDGRRLSHGFAINWNLQGDQVQVRTGAAVRCKDGVLAVIFTGWSSATLTFSVVDGRHWLQDSGALLSFQRRLRSWTTPKLGSACPDLAG